MSFIFLHLYVLKQREYHFHYFEGCIRAAEVDGSRPCTNTQVRYLRIVNLIAIHWCSD